MNEKTYKMMSNIGVANIAVGIITMMVGIAAGVVLIVNGVRLVKQKYGLTI
jgi:hypothetical protein